MVVLMPSEIETAAGYVIVSLVLIGVMIIFARLMQNKKPADLLNP